MIYRLSPLLGGRSEVLETPILEALHLLILQNQEREQKAKEREVEGFLDYLKLVHSHPLQTDDEEAVKSRDRFIESIRPNFGEEEVVDKKQTKYSWDAETQNKMERAIKERESNTE